METKPLKTVRFTKLVEESGHPVPVTLWTAPEDDRDFARAIREERVLTVVQRNVGAKSDYGLVGFYKEPLATYLVFPKKLTYPAETKVIGIKYEQLAEAQPNGPQYKRKPPGQPGALMEETVRPATVKGTREPHLSDKNHDREREPQTPKAQRPPPPPKLHRFRADVEISIHQVVAVEVEAANAKQAAELVQERVSQLQPNLETATIKKRASTPKRL